MRKSLSDYCREMECTFLLDEWDADKNAPITPETISYGSKRQAWWKCSNGHSWCTQVTARTCNRSGCPVCNGRIADTGVNDLFTVYPMLKPEWDFERNENIDPARILPSSHIHVWWRCNKGHSWNTSVKSRTQGGTGCPVCAGKMVLPGFNDLASAFPELASEWNSEKNGALTPHDVTPGSSRYVWWRCAMGHEWRTRVVTRTMGSCCPYCSGKKVLPGFNDLETENPALAAEWDTIKNGSLKPSGVTPYSNRHVWWRCVKGHEYRAMIAARNVSNTGCPYCAGRKVLAGFNDLESQEPKIAKEWAQDLNGNLTPDMVTTGSHKKVWWRCPDGHVWKAVVFSRTGKRRSGCPICAGHVKGRQSV